jgi:hypothetical protein
MYFYFSDRRLTIHSRPEYEIDRENKKNCGEKRPMSVYDDDCVCCCKELQSKHNRPKRRRRRKR